MVGAGKAFCASPTESLMMFWYGSIWFTMALTDVVAAKVAASGAEKSGGVTSFRNSALMSKSKSKDSKRIAASDWLPVVTAALSRAFCMIAVLGYCSEGTGCKKAAMVSVTLSVML